MKNYELLLNTSVCLEILTGDSQLVLVISNSKKVFQKDH